MDLEQQKLNEEIQQLQLALNSAPQNSEYILWGPHHHDDHHHDHHYDNAFLSEEKARPLTKVREVIQISVLY